MSRDIIAPMATLDPEGIFSKLKQDRGRMESLGITENVMVEFYNSCGAEGEGWDDSFATLKKRFKLSEEDSHFVERVLGDCGPF